MYYIFQVLEAKHNGIVAQVYNTHVLHSIFWCIQNKLTVCKVIKSQLLLKLGLL